MLKTSICKAFKLQRELRTDVFSKIEGEEFLLNEISFAEKQLPLEARKVAALVGYQKYALMIIGNMIAPLTLRKKGMKWSDVLEYVRLITEELHTLPLCAHDSK